MIKLFRKNGQVSHRPRHKKEQRLHNRLMSKHFFNGFKCVVMLSIMLTN